MADVPPVAFPAFIVTPEAPVTATLAPPTTGAGQNASSSSRGGGGTASAGNSATKAGGGKPSDRSLFISGLHPDAEFTHLHATFEKYGKIISCRVLKDARTGASRCIGYVNFHDPADAHCAIEGEHGKNGPAGGGPWSVRYAEDDPGFVPEETKKLFIRFVPVDTTADMLREAFAPYGTITDCTVMPDASAASRTSSELWNMGYVTFSTSEEATAACAKTHKSFILGPRHELMVKPAETLATRALRQRKHEGGSTSSTAQGSRHSMQQSGPAAMMFGGSGSAAGGFAMPLMPPGAGFAPIMMAPPGMAQPVMMMAPPVAQAPGFPIAPPGYRIAWLPATNGTMTPVLMPDGPMMGVPMPGLMAAQGGSAPGAPWVAAPQLFPMAAPATSAQAGGFPGPVMPQ